MNGQHSEFASMTTDIRHFAQVREWEKFHTPKNLAMAVAGEAGELVAEFQWLTPEECLRDALSVEKLQSIALEIADVQIYLIRLADVLGLDIPAVVQKKMSLNEVRFPPAATHHSESQG